MLKDSAFFLLLQGNDKASTEQKLCNYKYSGTDDQDFYIWRMPEHDAAIQLNLAPSRQQVKHRNNNITSGYFQNKTLCVDTSTHISKKRQTQALLLIPRSGTPVVVFRTHTYNCGCEWLCDYRGNSSASWCQLSTVLCCGRLKIGSKPLHSGQYPVDIRVTQHHQTLGACAWYEAKGVQRVWLL